MTAKKKPTKPTKTAEPPPLPEQLYYHTVFRVADPVMRRIATTALRSGLIVHLNTEPQGLIVMPPAHVFWKPVVA